MRQVLFLLVIFICFGPAAAQRTSDAELSDSIDEIAKKFLSRPVAGISIAVARDGQTIFSRGYGMANLEHSVGVTPETVFHIDSISKNILAGVLLQLVDEGKLSLDDDVKKYVPEAPTHERKVTVRQLLNQTSGIYSFTSLPEAAAKERLDLTHDQVLALIRDQPLDFEPGTKWRYDNSAFYLAGMVVERITKEEYGTYVREHVFKPLGMSSAQMCDARMVVPHLASGYEMDHGAIINAAFLSWKLPFAAGAICASATDLLKWQLELDAGRVLSHSSLMTMRTPTTLTDHTTIDYGLGTRLGWLEGHRIVGHTGTGGGFRSVLESFPEDHLAVVILMNTDGDSISVAAMAAEVARAVLGLPLNNGLQDLAVPKAELAALAPAKFDSDEGIVETFEQDGKLHFRIPARKNEGVLLRQAENIYAINENLEVHFLLNNHRAAWSVVYAGGLFVDAKYRVP